MPELEGHDKEIHGVLPAGSVLPGYELKSVLGKGAFGVTYRARDLTVNRDVAIKEYLPTSLAFRKGRTTVVPISTDHAEQFVWGRERFLEEARTLGRLDGTPAIVRAYDFLEANGTAYMVMELIEGETLNKRLMREQQLKSDAIERLLFPLLDGLEAVHAIRFLHRDIKPTNIMVDAEGQPTLIDFGASRAAMAERSTTLTAIFTPGYAAAEQFTGAKLGPWTDIYGLAATLYHAITGRIPPSSFERIFNDTYEPLFELAPEGFAPALLAGIDAGMALRVEDRPKSIAEWRDMLQSSTLATHLVRKPGPLARAASKTRKTGITLRGPALLGAVAAAILLVAGGGYLAMTANAPPTVDIAALSLSAEQLEQALAERRKADTLVAEKRRFEEEARQRAEADATAKRQADEELEKARQARLKADQELTELKESIESRRQTAADPRDHAATAAQRGSEEAAQRKAEAEAAALREAEEEAAKKAEADAETKRQADQALAVAEAQRKQAEADAQGKAEAEAAARRQASEEAQRKAEAEAASRRQADEAQAKAQAEREKAEAEAKIKADAKAEVDKAAAALAKLKEEGEVAERGLRIEQPERQRLQVALTSLGFDTRGNDGIWGSRSREMIAAWQKARNQPATGFLTGAQQQVLVKEAATALTKYDEQKKAEEEVKARATNPTTVAAGSPAAVPGGTWRGTYACGPGAATSGWAFTLPLQMPFADGSGSARFMPDDSNGNTAKLEVSVGPTGVTVTRSQIGASGRDVTLSGTYDGNAIRASGVETGAARRTCTLALTRDGSPMAGVASPAPAAAAQPALAAGIASSITPSSSAGTTNTAYDGTYGGNVVMALGQENRLRVTSTLQVTNGWGSGTLTAPGCDLGRFSATVAVNGNITGEGYFSCQLGSGITLGAIKVAGQFAGRSTTLRFSGERGGFVILLTPGAVASPSPFSLGGRWRGTYACDKPEVKAFGFGDPFTLDLALKFENSTSSGGVFTPSSANDQTAGVEVSISPPSVTATRTRIDMHQQSQRTFLHGQLDGNTIRASGKETSTSRTCTLALTRVP